MKLITEMMDDLTITEELDEATKTKSLHISGPFMQAEMKNRNGRFYPLSTLTKEATRYTKENISKNRAYGELGHPQGPTINLDRVSHMIKELKQDGNNFNGKAKIMDTPMGNIVSNLLKEGAGIGVSSRGMGSLKPTKNGDEVQEDFHLATPADIVADPSAPDAYVNGVMEGKEWIWDNGLLVEQIVDGHYKRIKAAKQRQLEEVKLDVFQDFLQKL